MTIETTIAQAKKVLTIEAEGILSLCDKIGPDFEKAVELILGCTGRVIIAGIGKSGIIGQKIAATFNSTGTPALFLHPVEAMHGDLGMVGPDDVILAISYSGETMELNMLLASLRNRSVRVIAMTGNSHSSLARGADAVLDIGVPREACPLGLAPTASTTATLAMGDALAVILLDRKQFRACDFRRNHPGGSLGERLKVKVSEVMLKGAEVPLVQEETLLRDTVQILNDKNIGAVLISDADHRLAGIVTDGDIRRLLTRNPDLERTRANDIMTALPKAIGPDLLAADALSIMQCHEITVLPVVDGDCRILGILHLHNLLGKGEFRFLV
jgi:arabinose-5-phosphate isomerase